MWGWRLAATALLVGSCGRIGYDATAQDPIDATPTSDASDVSEGLIARYAFDLDVGSDSLGAHDATCAPSCPKRDANGYRGAALDMGAGTEHLRVADTGGVFALAGGFTVSGWVRYRDHSARSCLFTKPVNGGGSNSWALCTEAGGAPFFYSCETCSFVRATQELPIDTWVHLAATFDGSTKALFVDGVFAGQVDGSITFDASDLIIGGDSDGAFGFATDGLLDEIRVYDRPLTREEVAILADH